MSVDSPAAPAPAWDSLRSRLQGDLALPGQEGYELAQAWDPAVRAEPAAVAFVADSADVQTVFRWASEQGLKVAVQLTGHGSAPRGPEVVVVHTRALDALAVDAGARRATVGAGVLAERLLTEAAAHGLAPAIGATASVGVVGYLSGGGIGPLASTLGLSADHVRSIEVVTGDGVLHRASATEEPELFWGLRGGRGALGVVTSVELELLPLAGVYGGSLVFAAEHAATVAHAWAQWSAGLDERATTSLALTQLPDLPFLPPQLAGKYTVAVRFATPFEAGGEAEATAWAEQALRPIRELAEPVLASLDARPYPQLGRISDEIAQPGPILQDQTLLSALPAEAVDALLAAAGPEARAPLGVVELRRLGGAFARTTPETEGSFDHRDAPYSLLTIGIPVPPIADFVAPATRAVLESVSAWSTGGAYANFVPAPERRSQTHRPETLRRLDALVAAHDPRGVVAP